MQMGLGLMLVPENTICLVTSLTGLYLVALLHNYIEIATYLLVTLETRRTVKLPSLPK